MPYTTSYIKYTNMKNIFSIRVLFNSPMKLCHCREQMWISQASTLSFYDYYQHSGARPTLALCQSQITWYHKCTNCNRKTNRLMLAYCVIILSNAWLTKKIYPNQTNASVRGRNRNCLSRYWFIGWLISDFWLEVTNITN